MDGGEAEDEVEGGEETARFAALDPWRWIQIYPAEITFIRRGAVGKLEPPSRRLQRHPGEEAEVEGPEVAAAAEAE